MLDGVVMAGFTMASLAEVKNDLESAYWFFNTTAFTNHPHALRCLADMKMAGRGTTRDVMGALSLYEQAAHKGNPAAMFVMGEKARKENDKYLAASWYGRAYVRGFDMAGDRLSMLL